MPDAFFFFFFFNFPAPNLLFGLQSHHHTGLVYSPISSDCWTSFSIFSVENYSRSVAWKQWAWSLPLYSQSSTRCAHYGPMETTSPTRFESTRPTVQQSLWRKRRCNDNSSAGFFRKIKVKRNRAPKLCKRLSGLKFQNTSIRAKDGIPSCLLLARTVIITDLVSPSLTGRQIHLNHYQAHIVLKSPVSDCLSIRD